VIYDENLIVNEDRYLIGEVINFGFETISNFKIFAIIHGFDNMTLEMGQNVSPIMEMKSGEIRKFTM